MIKICTYQILKTALGPEKTESYTVLKYVGAVVGHYAFLDLK